MSTHVGPMRVGHARVDITPPLGVPMGGYAARGSQGCEVIEAPLIADALVLEQDGVRVVLITADLIAIDEAWSQPLRVAVAKKLATSVSHVLVLATHTHFGPATRAREMGGPEHIRWLDEAAGAMTRAAEQAASHLRPATLRVGSGNVGAMMYNRRLRRRDGTCCTVYRLPLPEEGLSFGPVDPKLTVLRFDAEDEKPIALLASVGLHPVIGGGNFQGISPDYPGFLRQTVEAVYQIPCLFALGTAGNVVPMARGEGQRERMGRFLAGATLQAAETAIESNVRLRLVHEYVDLPAAPRSEGAAAEEGLARARQYVEECEAKGSTLAIRQAREALRRMENLVNAAKHLAPGSTVGFEITAVHLGDLALVALPGEIFVETGLLLQRRSPFPITLVLSLANQSTGYLPTREAFWEGGYEASVSIMNEDSEEAAAAAAARLLLQLWERGVCD